MGRKSSLALTALAVPLVLAGLVASYVKLELADPDAFADRSLVALRSDEVRAVIAEQVAVQLLERQSPELVASRPLVLAAVEAILETDSFARVLRRTAVTSHELLLEGERDVVVELAEARDVLLPAVRTASPELARSVPDDLSPQIAEIRQSDGATLVVRVADGASAAAIPLLGLGLILLAVGIRQAPDRRRGAVRAGLGLAAGAAVGLLAMAGLREQVLAQAGEVGVLSEDDARAAAGATWDALAGGLEDWLVAMAVAALMLVGGGLLAELRVDRARALSHAGEILAGGNLSRPLSALRGLALAAVGALVLLRAEPVLAAAVVTLGGALVLLGLAEALSAAGRTALPRDGRARRGPSRRVMAVAGVAGVAAVAVAIAVSGGGGPPAPPDEGEIDACNGLQALCERRLDEAVFAGTHNSMSAADRPGWFFANQVRPIPRQLEQGIRLLLIDPHYGVVDGQGRVRTDLRAEGTTRNRVARRLGADVVAAAERLAGRLGLLPADGEREVFLCHSLCELGAERMSSTLDGLRGFLERNPAEVVVVFVESSVDSGDVEEAFRSAGLERYLATLPRERPLPRLGELVASGRRVVVLDQDDGGDESWYQPAFVFVQDTKIRTLLDSPTACTPSRGTPESPLFMLNHWIDRFPPPPSENAAVNDRESLLRRVESCRRATGRVPNLIAVDFYDASGVLDAARELNIDGAAVSR